MRLTAIFALLGASLAPLHASTLDITADSQITLQANDGLIIGLGAWTYASQASGAGLTSPYPATISFTLSGLPEDLPTSLIPGTSASYIPGMLFSAVLESVDGSFSMPLLDSNAARLGLPDGDLVLGTGLRSGGSYSGPVSVVSATATLSSAQAADLFAAGSLEPWSEAFVMRLVNLGDDMTFGYSGAPVTSAVSVSLSSTGGSLSVGAMPLHVDLQDCPEPGTTTLLLLGVAAIALSRRIRLY